MKRDTLRLPFHAVYRNIIIDGPNAAAVYRLDTVSYEFLSKPEKERLHAQLAWFAYGVEADYSLYRVSRAYPAEQYVAETAGLVDERTAPGDLWDRYLERQAEHISRMRSFVTEVYIAIALREGRRKPWQRGRRGGEALVDAEQYTHDTLTDHLPARRATTTEVQWLLRRAGTRGIGEPELDANWQPPALMVEPSKAFQPRGATVVRHMATITERAPGLGLTGKCDLLVETEHGTSYQAFLALGATPRTMQFPGGAELMFTPLEVLTFPVDVACHVHWISNEEMQKLVRNRVKDADNAWEDQSHNPLSWSPEEHRIAARDCAEYFTTEPYPPGLETAISFAIGSADEEELAKRVAQLRRRFGAVKLYQPVGLQRELYEDHLLHPGPALVGDYAAVQTMEQFGGYMPIATHHAGASRGPYVGRTIPGVPRPVKFDLTEASRTNRSPTVLLCGALGRGKTVAAQLLCYQAALRGSRVVDIDPRPDHNLERLPGLEGLVHVIELTGEEANRGRLDPFVIAPEQMREDVASGYLVEILPEAHATWQTQIRRAVKRVLTEPNPSCLRVLNLLNGSQDEAARQVGAELEVWADTGLGRLAFGNGTHAATGAALPVTTIKAANLTLPPPGTPRSDWKNDQAERLSVATHKLMVAYAMRLVHGDRSVHKVLHVDEAHVFFGPGEGGRFLNRSVRMARSMNLTLLLSTQLLGDVGELESLIGTRLIFGQETDEEARAVLPILGLEPSERLVKMVRGFTNGRCLLRGIDDRVAQVQIDVVDPRILQALDTNPAVMPRVEVTP